MTAVQGLCPACAGATLFVAPRGNIRCARLECPKPTVVADLLDRSCDDDVLVLGETGWFTEHSLRCRVAGMANCEVHAAAMKLDGPPAEPGRYSATVVDGELVLRPEDAS